MKIMISQDENASLRVWNDNMRPYTSFRSLLDDLQEPLEIDVFLVDPKDLLASIDKEIGIWLEMLSSAREERGQSSLQDSQSHGTTVL